MDRIRDLYMLETKKEKMSIATTASYSPTTINGLDSRIT